MKDRRLDIEPMDSVIVIREDGRVELTLPRLNVQGVFVVSDGSITKASPGTWLGVCESKRKAAA